VIRAVFDTNVLVAGFSAAKTSSSPPAELLRRWRSRELRIVTSEHIIDELERSLEKPYFVERMSPEERAEVVQLFRRRAETVSIVEPVHGIATHVEDDLVLATALSGDVRYLVTGDAALLEIGTYREVTILRPSRFLSLLQNSSASN
jgi:putative PIN family toxin of toxin-antitoxin system